MRLGNVSLPQLGHEEVNQEVIQILVVQGLSKCTGSCLFGTLRRTEENQVLAFEPLDSVASASAEGQRVSPQGLPALSVTSLPLPPFSAQYTVLNCHNMGHTFYTLGTVWGPHGSPHPHNGPPSRPHVPHFRAEGNVASRSYPKRQ